MISFVVYGKAAPAGSKTVAFNSRGDHWVRDASKGSYAWKKQVAQVAGAHMAGRSLLEGPLRLSLQFVLPRPRRHFGTGRNAQRVSAAAPARPCVRPDLTKLVRAFEDACSGIVWRDDVQIVEQEVSKVYGEPARVLCEVERLGE